MDANTMKRMIVLKNLQSNMIEEAYVVFKNNVKSHKFEKINKELVKEKKEENRTKDYMLKEAEMIINDYICKIENKEFKFNNNLLKQKNNKLKIIAIIFSFLSLINFTMFILK